MSADRDRGSARAAERVRGLPGVPSTIRPRAHRKRLASSKHSSWPGQNRRRDRPSTTSQQSARGLALHLEQAPTSTPLTACVSTWIAMALLLKHRFLNVERKAIADLKHLASVTRGLLALADDLGEAADLRALMDERRASIAALNEQERELRSRASAWRQRLPVSSPTRTTKLQPSSAPQRRPVMRRVGFTGGAARRLREATHARRLRTSSRTRRRRQRTRSPLRSRRLNGGLALEPARTIRAPRRQG